MRSPSGPLRFDGTIGRSLITSGYVSTVTAAEQRSIPRPMRNRQRVSSHDLYQSMSVLRAHGLEKNFLESDGQYLQRHGIERARLADDRVGVSTRHQRDHPALPMDMRDARSSKLRVRCVP